MNETKTCPYCGSNDTGKLLKAIGDSPDCCFSCGSIWRPILMGWMDQDEIEITRRRFEAKR